MSEATEKACFVINPKSGGGSGARLLRRANRELPGASVHDLTTCDLVRALERAAADHEQVMICGGDGSISHVLNVIYETNLPLAAGLVPLGTGNDLARVLGWFDGAVSSPEVLLDRAKAAQAVTLDRMLLVGPDTRRSWFNYCSWGLDAEIALAFDRFRKVYPELCYSRHINLIWYASLAFEHTGRDLRRVLGTACDLPAGTRSLLCSNIPSYAGGMNLGPGVSFNDGCLDAFALPPSQQLLAVLGGRRRLRSLARCQFLEIDLYQDCPMQCDGEGWIASAGRYRVEVQGSVPVLTRR